MIYCISYLTLRQIKMVLFLNNDKKIHFSILFGAAKSRNIYQIRMALYQYVIFNSIFIEFTVPNLPIMILNVTNIKDHI